MVAELLDDYEEGTFTPGLGSTGSTSGQAYDGAGGVQTGTYTKIGNMVHIQGQVSTSTYGTLTTQVTIIGLPFTSDAATDAVIQIYHGAMVTGFAQVLGRIDEGLSQMSLVAFDSGDVNPTNLAPGHMNTGSNLRFSGTYQAAT